MNKLNFNPHIIMIVFLFVLLFCFGFFLNSKAETVVLKTGVTIEGRMLDMGGDYITLEVFGVPKTYDLGQVKSIDGKTFDMPPRVIINNSVPIVQATQDKKIRQKSKEPVIYVKPPGESKGQPLASDRPKDKGDDISKMEKIKKLKEKPTDEALAYFEIGYIHKSLGEDVLADQNYKKALKLDPNLGHKFFNQALDDFYLERHIDARDKLLRARELFEAQEDVRMVHLIKQQIRELYNDPDQDLF